MDNKITVTFDEYLDFRQILSKQVYETTWIEIFVEKLFIAYHSAYTQGRLDGIETMLHLGDSEE